MSGGTALMLMMKAGVLRPTRLVNLRRLGLDQIQRGAQGARPTIGRRSAWRWLSTDRKPASSSARRPTGRRGLRQWRRPRDCTSRAICTARRRTRSSCCAFISQERSMKRATQATETPQVGRSVPRLESWLKVTGRAEYVHNLRLPGMLYGKIFRSTVAHGRIKRIDVSAARALAGVHSVVTAAEVKTVVPDPYYGPAFHDQPVLAVDKVRYVGEPVAVVLASDPHV